MFALTLIRSRGDRFDFQTAHSTQAKFANYRSGIMTNIDKMSSEESIELLQKIGYGHLGCLHEGKPHVIPMQYYLKDNEIYIFTDRGGKSHDLSENPEICLQVEELGDKDNWSSITIGGRAEALADRADFAEIADFIKEQNPTFSPVLNRELNDSSELEREIAIYRIQPDRMTGTKATSASDRVFVG
jgi:uncharacterized protein